MLKRQLSSTPRSMMRLLGLCGCVMVGGTVTSQANAVSSNLDYVLTELSRQHNNASSLIKSARQPVASLALSSQLVSQSSNLNNNDSNVLERLSAVASNTVSKFSQTVPDRFRLLRFPCSQVGIEHLNAGHFIHRDICRE